MIAVIGPVVMDVTRLLAFEGEVVRDATDTDYLFTKFRISLEGVVGINSGQSWKILNDPNVGPTPIQTFGVGSAINSFAALRHALSQRLSFCLFEPGLRPTDAAQILLFCPGVDVNNGPKPLEATVLSVHGGGLTAFVRYTIEIAINECPLFRTNELRGGSNIIDRGVAPGLGLLNVGGQPLLLSNRWESGISYDQDTEAITYSLTGQATFRRDAMDLFFTVSPDEYRGVLLPPPPLNCKRLIDDIRVAPDGLTLQYRVRDVEQLVNYLDYDVPFNKVDQTLQNPAGPLREVAKVDVVVSKAYGQPGVSKVIDHALDAFGRTGQALPGGGDVLGIEEGAKILIRTGIGIYKTIDALFPYYRESATARVQLKRQGKMVTAQRLAYALISGALNYGNGQGILADGVANAVLLPPLEVTLQYSPTGKWLEASMSIERSGIIDFISLGTPGGIGTMLNPIADDLIGGSVPYSLASIAGALGAGPQRVLALIEKIGNRWGAQVDKIGKPDPNEVKQFGKELGLTNLIGFDDNRYSLLLTARDARVVGPNGDFYSRAFGDVIIRAAASLLRPCQTPTAAKSYKIPVARTTIPPAGEEKKPVGNPQPLQFPFPNQTIAKAAEDMVKQWERENKAGDGLELIAIPLK